MPYSDTSAPLASETSRNDPRPSPRYSRHVDGGRPSSGVHGQGLELTKNKSWWPSPSKSSTATPLPIVSGSSLSPARPVSCTKSTPDRAVMSTNGKAGTASSVTRVCGPAISNVKSSRSSVGVLSANQSPSPITDGTPRSEEHTSEL